MPVSERSHALTNLIRTAGEHELTLKKRREETERWAEDRTQCVCAPAAPFLGFTFLYEMLIKMLFCFLSSSDMRASLSFISQDFFAWGLFCGRKERVKNPVVWSGLVRGGICAIYSLKTFFSMIAKRENQGVQFPSCAIEK